MKQLNTLTLNGNSFEVADKYARQAIKNIEENGVSASVVQNNSLSDFIANTDIDYAYDNQTGANYSVIRIYKNKLDGSKQYPFVYAPNGADTSNMTTYDLATSQGCLLAINAGVFDTTSCTPDGILIQNKVVIQNTQSTIHPQCKPLTIDSNGDLSYAEYNADPNALVDSGIVSAVTGFMPIIVDYAPVSSEQWNSVQHYTQNAQRQIIGQFGNGDYAVITCEGRSFDNSDGWTIAEAQTICQKHGLKFAYNLDGGGSTETMLCKKHINTIYEGSTGRKVPTFIVFNGTTQFITNDESLQPDTPQFVIPPEYTQVEFIKTNGQQYINTGIPETDMFSVEYKVVNENLNAQSGHIMSSANTYIPFAKRFGNASNCNLIAKYKGNEQESNAQTEFVVDSTVPYVVRSTYSNDSITAYVDDVLKYTLRSGTSCDENNKYYLFAYGGNAAAEHYRFYGKFYYMIISDENGNKLHHYVPVKNSSAVYGLYDVVTGVFYESDTDVAFLGA